MGDQGAFIQHQQSWTTVTRHMPNDNLRAKSLEDVVNEVQALSAVASQPQMRSVAAVLGRSTLALTDGMQSLQDITFTAKKQIVERLDELSVQIKALQQALTTASNEASAQTRSILKWNKALVLVTGIYTLISLALLLATVLRSR